MSILKLLKYKYVWTGIAFLMLFLVQTYAFTGNNAKPRKKKATTERVSFSCKKQYHDVAISQDGDILVGNVRIVHDGMVLTCDSAVMYQNSNSFLAYGKVNFNDGDSLSLKCDSMYYDGTTEFTRAFSHNGKDVVMRHGTMTVYTQILNYDRLNNKGYYDTEGKIVDGKAVLTSQYGEYHTDDKTAYFHGIEHNDYNNVELINNKKDTLITKNLYYDTKTKWAHATGETYINSGGNEIFTHDGHYNTETGKSMLYDRPRLKNKNRKILADSIHYDKKTKRSFAYNNVVFTDTANHSILMGDYGWYDEEKGEAMCTQNAVMKDFTNIDDTLFIHGDTLRLYTYNNKTDSAYRVMHGYFHVRAYRSDMQMVCDSLCFISKDSCLTLYKDPIAWNDTRQIVGEEIQIFLNDSTVDSVYVDRQAIMIEQLSDTTLYNQIAGNQMRSFFSQGELKEFWVDGNGRIIDYPMEKDSTFLYLNYIEASKFRAYLKDKKLNKMVGFPQPKGTTYPLGMAPPERTKLEGFAWFDWIRPRDKYDIFDWRTKGDKNKLKELPRRNAPMQTLQRLSNTATTKIEEEKENIQKEADKALDEAGLEVKVE